MSDAAPHPNAPEGGQQEVDLYEKWRKIYPLRVKSGFQRMRRLVLVFLLGVFFAGPWLRWDGRPGVLFDLPAREFTVFWTTFYPQQFVLFSWLLIIAAFSLFVVTVMAGRIWCGWACPQTIWTMCYVQLEEWIEGGRRERMRRDQGPWNRDRITRKSIKWPVWLLLSFIISVTFVGYFVPIRELIPRVANLDVVGWEAFWVAFGAGFAFLFSGVLREQVCFHMCPYARFQSVMFDRDTLIISYDEERGEPRGKRHHGKDPAAEGLGSCVNCTLCVQVCPTGIDIRDGLQYQCIGCAACVDVCDGVMDQMGYPRGLVRYSSENRDEKKPVRRVRPRLVGYAAVLCAMIVVLGFGIAKRAPHAIDIIRDRNQLYRESWDGSVENVYTLMIMNREGHSRRLRISAEGDAKLEWIGKSEVEVAAGEQVSLPIRLMMRADDPTSAANTDVLFTLETLDPPNHRTTQKSRFLRPEVASEPGS